MEASQFPVAGVPEDPAEARLLGLYAQGEPDLLMQRIKVHGGRLSAEQLRSLGELARTYTPGCPLHVTTRQDIELHGLRMDDAPAVQASVHAAGLTSVGACGDSLRNVTLCPGCGVCPGTMNVSGVADAIRTSAESLPWIRALPRKFKVSVSGCPRACARPWINDVGLIAQSEGTFTAVLGGSLGAKPGTGMVVEEALGLGDVVPLVIGALRLFNRLGDREHRGRARLRHVRERLGDGPFREAVRVLMREEAGRGTWPVPRLRPGDGRASLQTRLHLPLGDIEAQTAGELADAAGRADATIRIGLEHDLWVYGAGELSLSEELAALARGPRIIACPGSAWCTRGLTDSRAAADGIRAALPADCGLSICINGCPNSCTHAAVADIGLVGRTRTVDGRRQPCYRLLVGGGKGRTPALARPFGPDVPASEVPRVVAWLAEHYAADVRNRPAPFGEFVAREQGRLAAGLPLRADGVPPGEEVTPQGDPGGRCCRSGACGGGVETDKSKHNGGRT